MPVLSYVYELFNVDQCQTYIHTLRWKDRPLQCPRCQSQDVDPWGTYPGEWPPLRQAASAKTGSGTSGAGVAASSSTRLSHC